MKKLKLFGLLALVMMASVILVACNKNNGGDDVLSAAQELQIKQDYINSFDDGMYRAIEDVTIHSYYGTYNGAIALIISYNDDYPQIPSSETVAGFTFGYANPGRLISVWKASIFYDLTQSYEQGFLTQGNVENIHNLHN